MSLSDEILPYLDPQTNLVTASDGGKDNEPLFTAILIQLLDFGTARFDYRSSLDMFLSNKGIYIREGVYYRYFGANDNSADNYVGSCSGNARASILRAGKRGFWCYSPDGKFNLKYWYLRFLGFRPFVYMVNGQSIGIFSQLAYAIANLFSLLGSSTDVGNLQLQWLQNRQVFGQHWLVDRAICLWRRLALMKWPGGMQEVFGIYHGQNHPFAVYSRHDFQ